jgi:hypothetical protein
MHLGFQRALSQEYETATTACGYMHRQTQTHRHTDTHTHSLSFDLTANHDEGVADLELGVVDDLVVAHAPRLLGVEDLLDELQHLQGRGGDGVRSRAAAREGAAAHAHHARTSIAPGTAMYGVTVL